MGGSMPWHSSRVLAVSRSSLILGVGIVQILKVRAYLNGLFNGYMMPLGHGYELCNLINFMVWYAKHTANVSYCSPGCHGSKSDNLGDLSSRIYVLHNQLLPVCAHNKINVNIGH